MFSPVPHECSMNELPKVADFPRSTWDRSPLITFWSLKADRKLHANSRKSSISPMMTVEATSTTHRRRTSILVVCINALLNALNRHNNGLIPAGCLLHKIIKWSPDYNFLQLELAHLCELLREEFFLGDTPAGPSFFRRRTYRWRSGSVIGCQTRNSTSLGYFDSIIEGRESSTPTDLRKNHP